MILAAFGVESDDPGYRDMRDEFLRIYEHNNLCVQSRLFPGMADLLRWLESVGIVWGVVTNKFERLARPIVGRLCAGHRVGVIVGGDTCSRAKPYPDPLLRAASVLGVEPGNTLYVGDDERDVQAARAAGMPVIVAGYGYLGDASPPALWGADGIVVAPSGVKTWIREQAREAAT
jgi:phosphoglycolate phosphatase